MKKSIKTTTEITKKVTLQLDREAVIELLGLDIPDDAEMYVWVPGGGDWSNMCLNIDKETPLIITWKGYSESVSEEP